jgi:hypothetical protein
LFDASTVRASETFVCGAQGVLLCANPEAAAGPGVSQGEGCLASIIFKYSVDAQ